MNVLFDELLEGIQVLNPRQYERHHNHLRRADDPPRRTWRTRSVLANGKQRQSMAELWALYNSEVYRGPARAFSTVYRHLIQLTGRNPIRLVLMMDESERLTNQPWGEDVCGHLRHLVTWPDMSREIALIMAGSTEFYTETTRRGSPLTNVLTRHHLSVLERCDIDKLACRIDGWVPGESTIDEIWRQSGGHPCIAQYLLHELWKTLPTATPEDFPTLMTTSPPVASATRPLMENAVASILPD